MRSISILAAAAALFTGISGMAGNAAISAGGRRPQRWTKPADRPTPATPDVSRQVRRQLEREWAKGAARMSGGTRYYAR